MSYAAIQALVSGKKPYWLYRIKRGDNFAYLTSRRTPITVGSDVYEPAAIKHSKIMQTSRERAAAVDLTLPNSNPVARQFLDMRGLEENSVTIWHGYENDPELAVKFRGRVVSNRASSTKIVLVCENNFTFLRSKGLASVVQRPCRHALYHGGCRLNIADWQDVGAVTNIDGLKLTVPQAASKPNGFYRGGVIEFSGAHQMITKHWGDKITLLGPMVGLAEEFAASGSADVKIAPGCNRSLGMCRTRFNNNRNYGGFPWMGENPFDGRSVY